ncbi:MAG: hypothetical protein DRJ03_02690 [Chloroflexi bacterium]|nr:MAG: hypothetical protein DRJ03_02690 [Chloroflexota bacterium]
MIFRLTNACDTVFVLQPSFESRDIGYGGRQSQRYKELGEDLNGFAVMMNPAYSPDADPRLRDDPEKMKWVKDMLINHPQNGKAFQEFKPEEQDTVVKAGELQNLRKKAAAYDELKAPKQRGRPPKEKEEADAAAVAG